MKTRIREHCIALALPALLTLNSHISTAFAQTTVFPIATNSNEFVTLEGGLASSGTNFLFGYNQNDTNVFLQLTGTNGTLLGNPILAGASKGEPRLCFGTTNYLAFWGDDFIQSGVDLYGQLISANGAAVGSAFPLLSSASGFQAEEAVAFDGTDFLVTWEYYEDTSSELYGEFVNESGSVTGGPFLIGDTVIGGLPEPSNDARTGLAFGATNYLFAWQIYANDSPEEWSTYGVLISRNGSVNGPFEISQTNSPSFNPVAVAYDGTNFLVVWNRDIGPGYPSSPNWNIDGRLVSPNGNFVGNEFTLETNQATSPSLAFDAANYLLSWASESRTNLYCQFFGRSGNTTGPAFALFQIGTNNFGLQTAICDRHRVIIGAMLGYLDYDSTGDITNASDALYGAVIPKSIAPPTLTAATRTGTQQSLQLTGTPGINYAIQMTTNLLAVHWTGMVTNSPTNGVFGFVDLNATNKSRFYRAVKQ